MFGDESRLPTSNTRGTASPLPCYSQSRPSCWQATMPISHDPLGKKIAAISDQIDSEAMRRCTVSRPVLCTRGCQHVSHHCTTNPHVKGQAGRFRPISLITPQMTIRRCDVLLRIHTHAGGQMILFIRRSFRSSLVTPYDVADVACAPARRERPETPATVYAFFMFSLHRVRVLYNSHNNNHIQHSRIKHPKLSIRVIRQPQGRPG